MGPKYEHFKFSVGDFVQQRINADSDHRKMIVVERIHQECPGGVQLHYRCRSMRESFQQYLEIELEDYKPDAVASDEDIAEMLSWRAERMARRKAKAEQKEAESRPPAG